MMVCVERLPAPYLANALFLSLILVACGQDKSEPAKVPSRVNALTVSTEEATEQARNEFCGARSDAELALSDLGAEGLGEGAIEAAKSKTVWVNFWATWCKPCVDEIPQLRAFEQRLAKEGHPLELIFVSVDEDAEKMKHFVSERAEYDIGSARVTDKNQFDKWLAHLGDVKASAVPIQILAKKGRANCVRGGAVDSTHYPTVKLLVK